MNKIDFFQDFYICTFSHLWQLLATTIGRFGPQVFSPKSRPESDGRVGCFRNWVGHYGDGEIYRVPKNRLFEKSQLHDMFFRKMPLEQ
jgi:hypothetical protein